MTRAALVIFVLVSAIVISGCTNTVPTGPGGVLPGPPGTGNLVLQITDQPGIDIQRADVTISGVHVHAIPMSGNESEEMEAGWITVNEGPETFDLVAIKDIKMVLGKAALPAGRYTQIRLDIDKAMVTIDSMLYNLTIPSGTLRLVRSFDIKEGQDTAITLDFNLQESVQSAGQFGKYLMNPVVILIKEDKPAKDQACLDSGGTILKELCCKSAEDLPNNCAIGACGCSYENSHNIKVCECGKDKCFDGNSCVQAS
jgi:hypothetical protein